MKRIMILSICLVLCLSMVSSAEKVLSEKKFQKATYGIKIGIEDAEFEYPVFNNEGNTYVSLRDICKELHIPVYWNEETKEAVVDKPNSEISISNSTKRKEDGIIPDKETALAIGKIILETYTGEKYEYETKNVKYFLVAEFNEEYNAWEIVQNYEYKKMPNFALGGGGKRPCIALSKNTGEVIYMNTYFTHKEILQKFDYQ